MKNLGTRFLGAVIVLALVAGVSFAQTVNVTFLINTATVSDTLGPTSMVTVTGGNAAITNWGDGIAATNIGGDYWSETVAFAKDDTVAFKFRVGGNWESNLDAGAGGNDRMLIVGANDTTLPVQFVNFSGNKMPQYWRPWGNNSADTTYIWFRTNMSGLSSKPFDENADTVGIRGDRSNGPTLAPYFGWSPTRYLTKESSGSGLTYPGKHFWSGVIKIPKDSLSAGDTLGYKYLIGYDWGRDEGVDRKIATPVVNKDTTIYFTYYNNEKPVVRVLSDTLDLTFIANMTTATQRGFTLNDTLKLIIGYFGTGRPLSGEIAETTVTMLKQGSTQNYAANVQILGSVGEYLDYQYYMRPSSSANLEREYYFNFDYAGDITAEQERRQIMVTAKTFSITDNVVSITDARRQPYFANPDTIQQTVSVLWQVNMKPAYYQLLGGETLTDVQGTTHITPALKDSIAVWGVHINGPATRFGATGAAAVDWQTWGGTLSSDTLRQLFDDGSHGDKVAGDSIWSRIIVYADTMSADIKKKGKIFKFGIKGGDNETGFGLNHLANIDDANPTFEILAYWGSINPNFYDYWDFNTNTPKIGTGVATVDGIPQAFNMSQNFPNPFNPSTSIDFSLPEASKVSLKVFNILGQEVAEIATGVLTAGTHRATFDASHLSTGIYFYRLTAGNFVSMKRMVLVK